MKQDRTGVLGQTIHVCGFCGHPSQSNLPGQELEEGRSSERGTESIQSMLTMGRFGDGNKSRRVEECQEWLMLFHLPHPPLRRTAIVSVENCSGSCDHVYCSLQGGATAPDSGHLSMAICVCGVIGRNDSPSRAIITQKVEISTQWMLD